MAKKQANVIEGLDGFTLGADTGPLTFVSTGHPQLDFAIAKGVLQSKESEEVTSHGGLPLGKMVEIYGPEGGGKSSLAYRTAGNAQRMGFRVAWIDAEHSFSPQLAEINGVDISELAYTNLTNPNDPDKIDDAEAIIDKMINACKSGKINVIILDSVACMTPKYTVEHDAEKQTVGALARALAAHLPKLGNYAAKHNVLCIFINQIRDKIGVMWGDPESSPGGRALKHACSVRLKITKSESKSSLIKVENDDGEEEVIGGMAYVAIKKNRFAAPVRESIEIPVYYKFYFPNFIDHLFNSGRQLNVIRVNKGVYSFGPVKETGRAAFIDAMQKVDASVLDSLVDEVIAKAEEKEVALPPEIMTYLQNRTKKIIKEINKNVESHDDESVDDNNKKIAKTKKKKQNDVTVDDLNI